MGLTYDTALSALYVDQAGLNRALAGTDAERKALFSGILNLERFAKAQEQAKLRLRTAETEQERAENEAARKREAAQRLSEFLRTLKEQRAADVAELSAERERAAEALRQCEKEEVCAKEGLAKAIGISAEAGKLMGQAARAFAAAEAQLRGKRTEHNELAALAKQKVCPTCAQKIPEKVFTGILAEMAGKLTQLEEALEKARKSARAANDLAKEKAQICEALYEDGRRAASASADARRACQMFAGRCAAAQKRSGEESKRQAELTKERAAAKAAEAEAQRLAGAAETLRYAVSALGKDGISARLAGALCPRLNRSAEFYSRLFSDGEIQAKFLLAEDALTVEIENAHGGETLADQSSGESRIASLIVSFALREVVSPSNLLIADEPGEGLDETNARRFAEGLLELKDRYHTIFVTSHNLHLLSVLAEERQVRIVKRGGISAVI
jgi:DNA repair exonuclease SbcCD ATPase subunit